MNEIIKEFAIYADFGQPLDTPRDKWHGWVAEDEDIEYFARLVALDCIKFMQSDETDHEVIVKQIKERFGLGG